jgi:NitT/TauT family transport system permease protein
MYPVSRDRQAKFRPGWDFRDFITLLAMLVMILGIVRTAAKFGGSYNSNLQILTDVRVLPGYTAQTLLRMVSAYLGSLGFTLVYAYTAYRSRIAALILIPLLDILQSIPVLSFLPGYC